MSETLASEQAKIKNFSCLTCRKRKVRCDRRHPCSQCVRLEKPCSFVPPVQGKSRRKKTPKEGLHAKLRRYEELLKSYGAKIEPIDDSDSLDGGSGFEQDIEMTDDPTLHINSRSEPFLHSRLVTKDGTSRYFDNGIWSNLGDEFHRLEEHGLVEATAESDRQAIAPTLDASDEHALVLSTGSTPQDLPNLHPPFPTLQKMWDIYVDRVDPIIKVLHLPTFWPTLINTLQNPQELPRDLEALIFAFYSTITSACSGDECQAIWGERQAIISARYTHAARQALINAEFLKTTSLITLQAFAIFLVGARGHYQLDSLFILSGVAVRLARRMGLHRDGASLGLSPFESEMRTRLWWYIVHIDLRASEFSGANPSKDLFLGDVKIPLNVEDEDLHPDMEKLPPERVGITSMVLCLVRCESTECRGDLAPPFYSDIRWERLLSSSMSLAEKDNLITQIEDLLERKYLRYCDPSNSLHCFASVMARSAICKMKLIAHNPRQFANSGTKVPQKERDIIFANSIKLLEYGNLMQSTPGLRKYMWQIRSGFLWDSLVYMLIETRHRKTGSEIDRVWQLIGGVFSNYPQIFAEASDALEAAVGNWTLQVWDDCAAARKTQGLPEIPTPEYISTLRRCRKLTAELSSRQIGPRDSGNAIGTSVDCAKDPSFGQVGYPDTDFEFHDSNDFSNLLSYDLEPNEWLRWDRLFGSIQD